MAIPQAASFDQITMAWLQWLSENRNIIDYQESYFLSFEEWSSVGKIEQSEYKEYFW